jgi:hypothetical protein
MASGATDRRDTDELIGPLSGSLDATVGGTVDGGSSIELTGSGCVGTGDEGAGWRSPLVRGLSAWNAAVTVVRSEVGRWSEQPLAVTPRAVSTVTAGHANTALARGPRWAAFCVRRCNQPTAGRNFDLLDEDIAANATPDSKPADRLSRWPHWPVLPGPDTGYPAAAPIGLRCVH